MVQVLHVIAPKYCFEACSYFLETNLELKKTASKLNTSKTLGGGVRLGGKKHFPPSLIFIFPEYHPAEFSLAVGRTFQTSHLERLRHFCAGKSAIICDILDSTVVIKIVLVSNVPSHPYIVGRNSGCGI